MKGLRFLFCSIIAFALLGGAAFFYDAYRLLQNRLLHAEERSREVRMHEQRIVSLLSSTLHHLSPGTAGKSTGNGTGGAGPGAENATALSVEAYYSSASEADRRQAFEDVLVLSARLQQSAEIRLADELAGAINRYYVAQRRYNEAAADYNKAAAGLRGKAARAITSLPARAD